MVGCDIASLSHPPPASDHHHSLWLSESAEHSCGAASCQTPNGHIQAFDNTWQFALQRGICWLIHTVVSQLCEQVHPTNHKV